jgi:2-polyprenyl-3-methyl-5-hydroxy-6-metoxy-1,4-benzoquinol methylase
MVFDQTWESIFQNQNWGKYPTEEIVRFLMSRFPNVAERRNTRVLDLGCGGGAHTWLLAREGFDTYGIDGSESAIRQAKSLLDDSGVTAQLRVGDFSRLDYPPESFDAVIDSGAIQHNPFEDIRAVHEQIWTLLKPGGHFCGLMINTDTSGWDEAERIEERTFRRFRNGPIRHDVVVHFFDESEVGLLMSRYQDVVIEQTTRTVNQRTDRLGHFVVMCQKPLG